MEDTKGELTAMRKRDEIIALAATGITREAIAKQVGVGVASVYRTLRSSTVTSSPPGLRGVIDKAKIFTDIVNKNALRREVGLPE